MTTARELHDLWNSSVTSATREMTAEQFRLVIRALDLLARTEESTDELVRGLKGCSLELNFSDAEYCDRAAFALVAQKRYIDDMHDTLDKIAAAIGVQGRDADKLLAALVALKAERDKLQSFHDAVANLVNGSNFDLTDSPKSFVATVTRFVAECRDFPKDAP